MLRFLYSGSLSSNSCRIWTRLVRLRTVCSIELRRCSVVPAIRSFTKSAGTSRGRISISVSDTYNFGSKYVKRTAALDNARNGKITHHFRRTNSARESLRLRFNPFIPGLKGSKRKRLSETQTPSYFLVPLVVF